MAEHGFQEVMRHWKRMCDTYTNEDAKSCCVGCRMYDKGCGAIYESDGVDFGEIEHEIMAWAAENPEPVYPSWVEWAQEMKIAPPEQICFHTWLLQPIPADIAKKLGVKPKEDV